MKQKEQYTLYELFDNLPIPLTELSKLSGKSHGTLTRIRDGLPARKDTINKLLLILSEVYKLELSTDNVTGIVLEERQQKSTEKAEKQPVPSPVVQSKPVTEKAPTRVYNRKEKDAGLPAGAILATDFARNHNVKRETFRDHLVIGLGAGVPWGMGDEMTVEKEHVDYSERPKPGRPKETERYLTADQQKAALEFWQRRKVPFTQCESTPCWCHTFLEEIE